MTDPCRNVGRLAKGNGRLHGDRQPARCRCLPDAEGAENRGLQIRLVPFCALLQEHKLGSEYTCIVSLARLSIAVPTPQETCPADAIKVQNSTQAPHLLQKEKERRWETKAPHNVAELQVEKPSCSWPASMDLPAPRAGPPNSAPSPLASLRLHGGGASSTSEGRPMLPTPSTVRWETGLVVTREGPKRFLSAASGGSSKASTAASASYMLEQGSGYFQESAGHGYNRSSGWNEEVTREGPKRFLSAASGGSSKASTAASASYMLEQGHGYNRSSGWNEEVGHIGSDAASGFKLNEMDLQGQPPLHENGHWNEGNFMSVDVAVAPPTCDEAVAEVALSARMLLAWQPHESGAAGIPGKAAPPLGRIHGNSCFSSEKDAVRRARGGEAAAALQGFEHCQNALRGGASAGAKKANFECTHRVSSFGSFSAKISLELLVDLLASHLQREDGQEVWRRLKKVLSWIQQLQEAGISWHPARAARFYLALLESQIPAGTLGQELEEAAKQLCGLVKAGQASFQQAETRRVVRLMDNCAQRGVAGWLGLVAAEAQRLWLEANEDLEVRERRLQRERAMRAMREERESLRQEQQRAQEALQAAEQLRIQGYDAFRQGQLPGNAAAKQDLFLEAMERYAEAIGMLSRCLETGLAQVPYLAAEVTRQRALLLSHAAQVELSCQRWAQAAALATAALEERD
ncbi:unnamed protein product [Symbiodinium natans]|uniref:Uncharacterized protein n=1 Tax=Symbiodinium natans TaxID=878477 RepID=A0A812NXZ5_9DINO|nr:unnamed protein product [Symbiodinium natans]